MLRPTQNQQVALSELRHTRDVVEFLSASLDAAKDRTVFLNDTDQIKLAQGEARTLVALLELIGASGFSTSGKRG